MDATVHGGGGGVDYLGGRGSFTISSLWCKHNLGCDTSGSENQINIDEEYLTFVLKMTPLLLEYFRGGLIVCM